MNVYSPVTTLPADVYAFVPGASTYHPRGAARADAVVHGLRSGIQIPGIFLTGGRANETDPSEAELMCDYIEMSGAPLPLDVILEVRSKNTAENFLRCAPTIAEESIDALSVITDRAHMARTLYLAELILPMGIDIIPVIAEHSATKYELARDIAAMAVTKATYVGVGEGAGPDEINRRLHYYEIGKALVGRAR